MTDLKATARPENDSGGFEGRARAAANAMEALRIAAERKLEELKKTKPGEIDAPALLKLLQDQGRALAAAVEAEGRAQDARLKREGGGGIDLDAARAEVRGRLARLAALEDPGDLS